MDCPLCNNNKITLFARDKLRKYYQCYICKLIFVPPEYYISRKEEKERYDLHTNSKDDKGYRSFLAKIYDPVLERIKKGDYGLDFGCGPSPVLSSMFIDAGFKMDIFDPIYVNNEEVFNRTYDFITATEVVEHFSKPYTELNRLYEMLNPNGYLAIMTNLYTESIDFKTWYYKNDKTHICFYSRESFKWLIKFWHAVIEFSGKDVIFIRKINK